VPCHGQHGGHGGQLGRSAAPAGWRQSDAGPRQRGRSGSGVPGNAAQGCARAVRSKNGRGGRSAAAARPRSAGGVGINAGKGRTGRGPQHESVLRVEARGGGPELGVRRRGGARAVPEAGGRGIFDSRRGGGWSLCRGWGGR
jgi:hypothetical protein